MRYTRNQQSYVIFLKEYLEFTIILSEFTKKALNATLPHVDVF